MSVDQNIKLNAFSTSSSSAFYTFSSSAVSTDTEKYILAAPEDTDNIIIEDNGRYSIFDVANWFLSKGDMTPKKLQKLCYYAQAWTYALKGYRLENTDYQAWIHGPVSPALWERFKSFGYDTICLKGHYVNNFTEEDNKLLEDVWDTYGDNTGNALEALTHRELPWIEARRGYEPEERCTVVISPNTMATYYKSIFCGD